MTIGQLLLCLIAGVLFGTWPCIMRESGLDPILAGLILQIGSAAVFLPFFFLRKSTVDFKTLAVFGILLAIVTSIMNGLGQVAFQKVLAGQPKPDMSAVTGTLVSVQVLTAVMISGFMLGGTFTVKRFIGVAAAFTAVYFLR